ncbi:hypothetical protein INT45_002935 [Circinella minor]|uniref:Uncharacterized protein n=1 Tax=Circinella minor TaxID=1195481 RepID=A0A8H7S859_9FUNG|nr:hypothetical protein INT45_002935 [Circinella minor]
MSDKTITYYCQFCQKYISSNFEPKRIHLDRCLKKHFDSIESMPSQLGASLFMPSSNNINLQSNPTCMSTDQKPLSPLDVIDNTSNILVQDYHEDSYQWDHSSSGPKDFEDDDESIAADDETLRPIQLPSNPNFSSIFAPSSVTKPATKQTPNKIPHYDFRTNTNHFMNNHIQTSIDLYALAVEYGAPRELFKRMINRINRFTDGKLPPLLSYNLSKQYLRNSFSVKPIICPICPNGCKMYLPGDKATDCTHCSTARYKEGSTTEPVKIMQQLSLKGQLALPVSDNTTREMLKYRSKRPTKENVMTDIFYGKLYNNVKHLFENELVIGLGLYTADYQQFKSSKHSMTIVHLTMLNINPKHRMENQLMLQVGILPEPNKPQDMTFFKPLLNDLEQLCKNGIIVETEANPLCVHAHLLFCGGDILAVAKMAGHSFHTHDRGCRFCLIRGEFMLNCMTFPPKTTLRTRVGKQLWRIVIGEYGKEGNPLYLSPKTCREFGELVADSCKLSAVFPDDCGDICIHGGFYRSIDWIHFVSYLVSSLLLEYYTDKSTCDALMNLATAFK